MLSPGVGSRVFLAPQSEESMGGGGQIEGSTRTFSHSRALPLEEALEVLLVECLQGYIRSLPQPGLVPEFCLRHETLAAFLKRRPEYGQLTRAEVNGANRPSVLLGAAYAPQGDGVNPGGLLSAVRSSLSRLTLPPHSSQGGRPEELPDLETRIVRKIESFFEACAAKFLRSRYPREQTETSIHKWIDSKLLHSFCIDIERVLGEPETVALKLLGVSNHFEAMSALAEESSLACAKYLVDYAMTKLLFKPDTEWVNASTLRVVSTDGSQDWHRALGDKVLAAVSASWEARPCVCREVVVMPAEDFFQKFPPFAEFEKDELGRAHIVILPSFNDEAPPRLYAFQNRKGDGALSDALVRDLEWVALKYRNAFIRIQARAHDSTH